MRAAYAAGQLTCTPGAWHDEYDRGRQKLAGFLYGLYPNLYEPCPLGTGNKARSKNGTMPLVSYKVSMLATLSTLTLKNLAHDYKALKAAIRVSRSPPMTQNKSSLNRA